MPTEESCKHRLEVSQERYYMYYMHYSWIGGAGPLKAGRGQMRPPEVPDTSRELHDLVFATLSLILFWSNHFWLFSHFFSVMGIFTWCHCIVAHWKSVAWFFFFVKTLRWLTVKRLLWNTELWTYRQNQFCFHCQAYPTLNLWAKSSPSLHCFCQAVITKATNLGAKDK